VRYRKTCIALLLIRSRVPCIETGRPLLMGPM